jgi:hypothetical protein
VTKNGQSQASERENAIQKKPKVVEKKRKKTITKID